MEVNLESQEAWETLCAQLQEHGGCMVPLGDIDPPERLATLAVEFRIDGRLVSSANAQVLHVLDAEIALMFDETERKRLLDKPMPDERKLSGGNRGEPLWKRWDSLSKAEKIKIARYGNQSERRHVLKDRDGSLHQHILSNPGLKGDELAKIIAGGVSAAFIRAVTQRQQFMGNRSVQQALVFNPLTPVPLAVRLLNRLPKEVSKRIAKLGNLRQPIVAAARRKIRERY